MGGDSHHGQSFPVHTHNVIFKSEAFGDPAFENLSNYNKRLDSHAMRENDRGIQIKNGK